MMKNASVPRGEVDVTHSRTPLFGGGVDHDGRKYVREGTWRRVESDGRIQMRSYEGVEIQAGELAVGDTSGARAPVALLAMMDGSNGASSEEVVARLEVEDVGKRYWSGLGVARSSTVLSWWALRRMMHKGRTASVRSIPLCH